MGLATLALGVACTGMQSFKILNPRFDLDVRETFSSQSFLSMIGAEIVSVSPGTVDISLPCADHLLQHHGYLHGAVVAAIVDTACGCSALTLMPPHSSVLTVEYKVNFLAPAAGDRILARGRVVKAGRRLTVCRGEAYATSGGREEMVAALMATMIRIPATSAAGGARDGG